MADDIVLRQMADELRWALEHAPESYAVLNACRALRYRFERAICSKSDAGRWALGEGVDPSLVQRALSARQRGVGVGMTRDAVNFVSAVANDLAST